MHSARIELHLLLLIGTSACDKLANYPFSLSQPEGLVPA